MPQIGWFELLLIILVAILVIGPKDFPTVLRKIGSWTTKIKKYWSEENSPLIWAYERGAKCITNQSGIYYFGYSSIWSFKRAAELRKQE